MNEINKKVLLIGRNPNVLAGLASALMEEGFAVQTTNHVEQAGQDFNAAEFDLIAFGRGIDEDTNARLRADFLAQKSTIHFVDGLAPVIPLLVRQIQLALADHTSSEKIITNFSCQQADNLAIQIAVIIACQLKIDLYQLDAVHHTQHRILVYEHVTAGNHTFLADIHPSLNSTINFLVVEADKRDLQVLALQ